MNHTEPTPAWRSNRALLGLAAAGLLLCGCAASGTVPSSTATSDAARAKAATLNTQLAAAGLPAIPVDTAGALYGVDGGISCTNAAQTQHHLGLAQFGNASGNLRRIIVDPTLIDYDRAVITTYCPANLAGFEAEVLGLTTAATIP